MPIPEDQSQAPGGGVPKLEPPRWRGGPEICPLVNLPYFRTPDDFGVFAKKLAPETGCKGALVECSRCDFLKAKEDTGQSCGGWHFLTGGHEQQYLRLKALLADIERNPVVILTPKELERADREGRLRRKDSATLHDYNGAELKSEEDFLEQDINARGAEIAWARFSGLPEAPVIGAYRSADSGVHTQVRSTKLPNGCLIYRHRDSQTHSFVLLIGTRPRYTIAGWLSGAGCMSAGRYVGGPKPMWLVPQHKLKPVSDLLRIIGA